MSRRSLIAHDLQTLIVGMLRVADAVLVAAAALTSYWIRHETLEIPDLYIIAIIVAMGLALNFMQIAGLYRFDTLSRLTIQTGKLAMSWTAVIMTLIALAYFTQTSIAFSRAFVLGWFALSFAGFILIRLALLLQIDRWRRAGRLSLNVAIVGAGEVGQHLVRQIQAERDSGYRIVGIFDDRTSGIPSEIEGIHVVGTTDELIGFVRTHPVDEVIVALPWRASTNLEELVKKLKSISANVKLCPDYVGWSMPALGFHMLAGVPMLSVLERPISGWAIVVKALEDRVLAAFLLVLFLPLMATIALAIKLTSSGPVLFRQTRYGFNNNPITVLKFRTMLHEKADEPEVPQARRNDPRVTRLGAILRRSSLDELPQLINVLNGEMSLVGPRPHAVAHNEQYAKIIDDYLSRHRVKPGITGWAQVNGLRGETDTLEKMRLRVQHDLYYIDNWSLWFDLKILFLTPFVGFVHRHAY